MWEDHPIDGWGEVGLIKWTSSLLGASLATQTVKNLPANAGDQDSITQWTMQSMEFSRPVGSLSLLQGIFPIQGSNSGLLHCRRSLYQLSHQGSHTGVGCNFLLQCKKSEKWKWSRVRLIFLKRSLVFPILLFSSVCTDHWRRLSYLFLLFFRTLHSNAYIFPFLLCFSLLFFSQLFVSPPQTAILLVCISLGDGLDLCLLYNATNLSP